MSQLQVPVSFQEMQRKWSILARLSHRISWSEVGLKLGLMGFYTLIVYAAIATGAFTDPFSAMFENKWSSGLVWGASLYTSTMMFAMLVRVILVMFYKPMASVSDKDLPSVSVIIPAYNEGPDVAKSIESIARSNYPMEKLQIITIDDGSKDDTWEHMDRAAKRYPENVCAIRMETNGGKRQGLRVGFALAAGDVIVTMDSDSFVERDGLRNLVTPFVKDKNIGAVAGNVKVENKRAGILPRMMRASFVVAFDFTRAYQSMIKTVQCTPGAFSAYRRTVVEKVLHEWNGQKFFGKPSTIAEDRALTNLVLKEGYDVTFQGNATVWTNVPTTYKGMSRMYMRWERGNLRENLTYASFCWKPFKKLWWAANIDFVLNFAEMFFPYVLIVSALAYTLVNPFFGLKYFSMIVLFSAAMQLYYIKQEKDTDFVYGILYSLFYFSCLWWVVPYSVLTAANGSWMTRQLPTAKVLAEPVNEIALDDQPKALERLAA